MPIIGEYKGINLLTIPNRNDKRIYTASGCVWLFAKLTEVKNYIDSHIKNNQITITNRKSIRLNNVSVCDWYN